MLTIDAIKGDGRYFTELAKANYYIDGGEPPGFWIGDAAQCMGLSGKAVSKERLRNILRGYHPDDQKKKLVQNAGKDKRHRGYDLTFSAPKSFSIAKSLADEPLRKVMEKCLYESVEEAVNFANKYAVYTRRGKAGNEAQHAKAVVCAFPHSASRADEPQDHVHTLWANACLREDGTTGTFFGQVHPKEEGKPRMGWNPLINHKYAIGSVMQLSLATKLGALGFQLEKDPGNEFAFRLKEIPKAAEEFYSTRAKEVEAEKERVGLKKGKASYIAAVTTARDKGEVDRKKLYRKSAEDMKQFGLTHQTISGMIRSAPSQPVDLPRLIKSAITDSHLSITESKSHFNEAELFEKVANNLVVSGAKLGDIEKHVSESISKELYTLGSERLQQVFTNAQTLQLENAAMSAIELSVRDRSHRVSEQTLDVAINATEKDRGLSYNAEYREALRYLTTGETKSGEQAGAVRVLTGDAGSGKTTLLATAAKAFEAEGYRVVGASLTNQATEKLQKETGIESHSVAKWCWDFERKGLLAKLNVKHHIRMWGRAAMKGETWMQSPSLRLDEKTVLVVDEATLTSTPMLYEMQIQAQKAGALMVLAKDDKQCQAIGLGGAAELASRVCEGARLSGNFRQTNPADRKLVADAAEGRSLFTLDNLISRNKLHVAETVDKAIERLVGDWANEGVRTPEQNKIFVGKNEDRLAINEKCQKKRINAAKTFFGFGFTNFEGQKIYAGDVIQFKDTLLLQKKKGHDFLDRMKTEFQRFNPLENSPTEKVNRGQYGTVAAINPFKKTFTVKVDDGRTLTVPMSVVDEQKRTWIGEAKKGILNNRAKTRQTKIALGYATTTHTGQGSDYDNVFVLTSGWMQDKELSYTQLSRARKSVELYSTEIEAGGELTLRSKLNDSTGAGINEIAAELEKIKRVPGQRLEDSPLAKSMARSRKKEFSTEHVRLQALREQEVLRGQEVEKTETRKLM